MSAKKTSKHVDVPLYHDVVKGCLFKAWNVLPSLNQKAQRISALWIQRCMRGNLHGSIVATCRFLTEFPLDQSGPHQHLDVIHKWCKHIGHRPKPVQGNPKQACLKCSPVQGWKTLKKWVSLGSSPSREWKSGSGKGTLRKDASVNSREPLNQDDFFSNHPSIIYPYLSCSILQVTFLLGRIFAACPTQLDDARVLRFGRSSKVLTEKNQKSR